MALKIDQEIDYSKSTNAYPMPKEPTPLFIDNSDIDYSKSTGAVEMYDGTEGVSAERIVEHIDAPVEPQFQTPGPMSHGDEELIVKQRADLGLSEDPSGESDAGYEARPSSAGGSVEGESTAKVVEAPKARRPRKAAADTKNG